MIVECPGCTTIFPVDPKKVPDGGIHARCTVCNDVFFVTVSEPTQEEPQAADAAGAESGVVQETDSGFAQEEDVFGEPMVTLDDDPIRAEETFSPVEDTPAPPEETFSPAEDTPALAEDAFPPVEDTSAPPEETFSPAEGPSGPAEDEPIHAGDFRSSEVTTEPEGVETWAEPGFAPPEGSAPPEEDAPEPPASPTPSFGKRDPKDKAQRLARVLVSDIILYNPDRHQAATEAGRVKEEFEEEIAKSWTEYVEQVGEEVANSTPFFEDALNEILAKGEKIF